MTRASDDSAGSGPGGERPDASTLELGDPAFTADPYPALRELRRRGPVLWHEPTERWLVTSHAAVGQALRDRRLGRVWSDHEPRSVMEPFNLLHRHQMMENEPPEHTRLRRPVARAFGRGHVERLRPRIEAVAGALLDDLLTRDGPVDLIGEYAEPLPVAVIADLLGVPGTDHHRLRDWSQAIVRMYEPDVDEATRIAAADAATAFAEAVRELVAERRRRPADDLVSDLVADAGAELGADELVASIVLLLNAGHEASVNAFGNGLLALLEHPGQLDRLRHGQVSVETALEELLRYDTPLQLFERTAVADLELAGAGIAAGQTVACLMGSANRDEEVFAAAADLDLARDPNPHVGFGLGVHFCLGAPLARLELGTALRVLRDRTTSLHPVGEPVRRPTWVLRGLRRLDIDLEAA